MLSLYSHDDKTTLSFDSPMTKMVIHGHIFRSSTNSIRQHTTISHFTAAEHVHNKIRFLGGLILAAKLLEVSLYLIVSDIFHVVFRECYNFMGQILK